MLLEWWWLICLFPVFFGLGWWAARIDKKQLKQGQAGLPNSYFHGLNFLLNERPDEAIDAFIQVVKVDPETLELHFALGSLFRRRGEIDRAIKIHQSLCARTDLPPEKQSMAQYELGLDFLKAGMFDRAEKVLTPLVNGHDGLASQIALLQVYQQTRMWQEALQVAKQLEAQNTPHYQALQVHFYCEMIEQKQASNTLDLVKVQECFAAADVLNAKHPRLLWLKGSIALKLEQVEMAESHFSTLYDQGGISMLLVAPLWANLMLQQQKNEAALDLLKKCYIELPSTIVLKIWCEHHQKIHGAQSTAQALAQWLKDRPNLWIYAQLLIVRASVDPQIAVDDELNIVKGLLLKRLAQQEQYICGHCGFRARQHYWQCPGCHQWDTFAHLSLNSN